MKFTISILTHTALEQAKKCIWSVLENSGDSYRLILTSNGNPDAAKWFQQISALDKNIDVVVNDENLGFIIPNRHALTMTDSEYFVMANDDTVLPYGWLEKLEAPFLANPKCAMSGPVGGHYKHSSNPDKNAIEYIFGWCMMGRTALLKEVGLFSDYLTHSYCEELDLQLRLLQRGCTLHVVPDCKVKHEGRATSRHMPGMAAIERRNFLEVRRRFPQYFANERVRT